LQGLGVDYETRQALLGHSAARNDSDLFTRWS
jgi:hypothetical protein